MNWLNTSLPSEQVFLALGLSFFFPYHVNTWGCVGFFVSLGNF